MKYLLSVLALCLLLSACDSTPSGDPNVSLAITAYENGEYGLAKEELKTALDRKLFTYSLADVYNLLGNIADDEYELDSALYYYELSLKEDPAQVTAWVNKGIIYRLMDDYDMAEACYLEAESRDPNDPELLASMGALFLFKEDVAKSIAYLERSIELDPALAVAHSNYAIALATDGRFDEAEAALKQAVLRGYKNAEAVRERIDQYRAIYGE